MSRRKDRHTKGIFSRRLATPRQRRILFFAYNERCALCRSLLNHGWHAHHIEHYAHGGYTDIDNLIPVCEQCHKYLLHKGKGMPQPRRWQQDCLEVTSPKQYVFVRAGTGSGKGFYIPAHYHERVIRGQTDFGIFFAPSQTILEGITEWAGHFGLRIIRCENPTKDISTSAIPAACHGIALTYSGMSEEVTDRLISWAKQCKLLVSLDEAHHITGPTGGGKVGVQSLRINRLLEHANLLLLTTATPFRSDMLELLGVEYQDGIAQPDYEYSYRQSVVDGYCRSLYAEGQDGVSSVSEDGVNFSKRVSEIARADVEKKGVGLDSELVGTIIDRTYQQLRLDRQKYPDAAALFVAPPTMPSERGDEDDQRGRENDAKNAEILRRIIKRRTGIDPVVLTSDDSFARSKIKQFRNGSEPLVVAVRMVSEGVDIPRIRNIGICTHIMSESMIIQIAGRALRVQPKEVRGEAHVFFPAYPWMMDVLQEMDAEARAAEAFISKDPSGGGDPAPKRVVYGIGATFDSREAAAPVAMTGSEFYHNEMISYVDNMMETHPFLDRGTASTVVHSLWGQIKKNEPIDDEPEESYRDTFDQDWAKFSKAVRRWGVQLEVNGYRNEYQNIYLQAYKVVGREQNVAIKADNNGRYQPWIRMNAPSIVQHLTAYVYKAMSEDRRIQGER